MTNIRLGQAQTLAGTTLILATDTYTRTQNAQHAEMIRHSHFELKIPGTDHYKDFHASNRNLFGQDYPTMCDTLGTRHPKLLGRSAARFAASKARFGRCSFLVM